MNRFQTIAAVLTVGVALLGVMTGAGWIPWPVVACAGVIAGMWWAVGRKLLGIERAEPGRELS